MNTDPELPPLSPEMGINYDCLLELFFRQMMTFSDFINDTNGKVGTHKYAAYVVYAMAKRLEEHCREKRLPMPKKTGEWYENEDNT